MRGQGKEGRKGARSRHGTAAGAAGAVCGAVGGRVECGGWGISVGWGFDFSRPVWPCGFSTFLREW
jgi:hypothetical protein